MKRLPDPTFDQRIADWLEDDPTLAPPEVLGTILAAFPSIEQRRAWRAPRRFPTMTRYVIPAAAALVVIIGGALLLPRVVTLPPGNQSPSPSLEQMSSVPTTIPTDAPVTADPPLAAAELVAFQVRIYNGLGRSTIWVESVDGRTSRELLPDEAGSWLLGRTSDGARLLISLFGEQPSLALVDITTGELQRVPTDCPADPCWADLLSPFGQIGGVTLASDDETAVAVLRDESNGHEVIGTIDLATGETSIVEGSQGVFVPGPGIVYPRLSPDGQKVAYIVGNANPRSCYSPDAGMLRVVDRFGDASTQRELAPFKACAQDPRWSPTGDELLYSTAEVTLIPTGSAPPGGTTSIAVEHHDVYRVSVSGTIERLTRDRVSSHSAWTRDGRISFAICDPSCDEPVLEVWILDPGTNERAPVEGTLAALGDAGCVECPFTWVNDDPPHNSLVVGLWPEGGIEQ
jgi:hypothetical protein